ncbi:MAG: FG-GAP-like repeat-containing protein [Candidatus Cloacimonetes bacterium]|nr:FG-GAP-like repeat-containing protein [Candidatus Cloacimonadota bacterium]MCF7812868.1 FG-GAP-like repeat-containing protein [Candidatus Cloacimonadota bacterium]MCF7867080.1 FG-GAP-like repeat-containing protein [Candidatus Cloacimonadota bacterium]MCF7882600.1 FG-GAP-like repeat-containing protein [Candidatus Cloacimonadota bacterium]
MKTNFVLFFIIFSISLFSITINIPDDYATIQEGIDASANGDIVLVQPGTYLENLNFNGKLITVASLYHTTQDTSYISQTIIDGNQMGGVVLFESGEDSTAVLTGFKLQNGSGTSYTTPSGSLHVFGGAVFCNLASSPKLENLIISNCNAEYGGGICAYDNSLPIIDKIEVYGCNSDKGGAVYYNVGGGGNITNSFFHDNSARRGAAVFYREAPLVDPVIDNCVFLHNQAIERAGAIGTFNTNLTVKNSIMEGNSANLGGAMFIWLQTIVLQNVLVYDNISTSDGGAIFSSQCSSYYINSAFYNNSSNADGGAFYGWSGSSPYFVNSVLWGNLPQQIHCRVDGGQNTVTSEYSCIEGGETGISTVNTIVNWLDGNIDTDPLIDDQYLLTENSPCIDSGTSILPVPYELTTFDLAGEDRIYGDEVDMGPYEYFVEETFSFTQITTGNIVNDGGWNYDCCWADFDADGWDDLFVCNNDGDNGKHNFYYLNNQDGTFTKVTDGDIVTDGDSSYGCAPGDFDNDGDIDLFVSNYNENNALYENLGDGTFTRITTGDIVNNSGSSTDCEWVDYNKDGWLDLFVCNRTQANFLYQNNADGTFTRITGDPLVSENKNSGSCVWADFDDNSYPDVFIANSGPDTNSLFLNNGDGSFTALQNDPIVSEMENFDISATGDYDNDGDYDIYVAPGMLPAGSYDVYLYQNDGNASFTRVQNIPHDNINAGGGCDFVDIDFDGDLDIFHQAYDGFNLILENDGLGNFSQTSEGVLANDGNYNKQASWTDYDDDGDLDVFFAVNNYFGGNNKLFQNNGNGNNWLYVELEGYNSNYYGIGCEILSVAEIGGSVVSQNTLVNADNSIITRIGFGDAETVGSILVMWPSGEISQLNDIETNQMILVSEQISPHSDDILQAETIILNQNFPNPFNPSTTISFSVTQSSDFATIEIYNLKGQKVKMFTFPNQSSQEATNWQAGLGTSKGVIVWNGTDENNKPVSSGVYFYKLKQGKQQLTKKMLLLK